jgi:coenzyme F420-reducing hydrogenase delta subunit
MKGRVSVGDQNAYQAVVLIRKYLKEIVCEDMKCNVIYPSSSEKDSFEDSENTVIQL